MTKMTAKGSLSFAVLVIMVVAVLQCGMTEGKFTPVKWSPSLSEQCGEHGSPELTAALTTVAEIIVNNKAPNSLPKSCMEIKETSPVSPSGFYTISDESSNDSGVVVYCNMEDLSSCSALEQTLDGFNQDVEKVLSGFMEDVDSLKQTVIGLNDDVEQSLSGLHVCIDSALPRSCSEVKGRCPQCESGVYEIAPEPSSVYCEFVNSTYCNVTGPWVKVASWNISESGSSCPSGLQLFSNGTVSACGIPEGTPEGAECHSLPLFTSPVSYSHVCGTMRGYQKGSTDGIRAVSNINDDYVDGVIITQGSLQQHIWSFASGYYENYLGYANLCPCALGAGESPPLFVGSDYFCESGSSSYPSLTTIYWADPLWDGEGCHGSEEQCCAAPGLPWFHKVLDTSTTDYIEMRVCINEGSSNENVLISSFEIYVL